MSGFLEAARLRHLLSWVRSQLWLLPALMAAVGALLAALVLGSGVALEAPFDRAWWLYSGDAGTARDLLSTLLSGLLTMTSLVVSMTFVVLTLAANQLGPRLVTIITGDRTVQAVLGFFLGTIVYVLVILRSLDETLGAKGVPHFAITVASGLTLLCLLALLFYVHRISRSIISDVVVRRVAHEFENAIDDVRESGVETGPEGLPGGPSTPVALGKAGYIQTIDYGALVDLAAKEAVALRLSVRAGHFVLRQGAHIEVLGRMPDNGFVEKLRSAFVIESERSPAQDLEYSVRQLVETALRALSTGIKDPFTVIAVVDHLAAGIEKLFARGDGAARDLRDKAGAIRVMADQSDLAGVVDAAFDQLRQGAADEPAILIHLADALGKLGVAARTREAREILKTHVEKVAETAEASLSIPVDRKSVLDRVAAARAALNG